LPQGTGGLERDSVLRLALLQPIAKSDLGSEIGQLDAETLEKIQTVLMVNFGILPRPHKR
jgi:mRNA-degrading endonuclease toxin of MazEF toxin-antitoxin module